LWNYEEWCRWNATKQKPIVTQKNTA
jgi:hypothetical protein